jgi:fatty-acyl-CoA synthase
MAARCCGTGTDSLAANRERVIAPQELTLGERLRSSAAQHGDRVFCRFYRGAEIETITIAQLYERSCAYAAEYRERRVREGAIVAIVLHHTPDLFYAFLGAALAGAIPAFLPYPTPKQRPELYWDDHRRLFARIDPAVIVTYEALAPVARERIPERAQTLVIAEHPRAASSALPVVNGLDRPALLQHSSGTTGLKKGVVLSHRAVNRQLAAYGRAIGVTRDDVIASWLPLYHDMGLIACFLGAFIHGIPLVFLDAFAWSARPSILFDAIERWSATLCWMPNFAFLHSANAVPPSRTWDVRSMRAFINCSEPCRPAAFDRFIERFAASGITPEKLATCYALAENVFAVTQSPIGREPARAVDGKLGILSSGVPIDGTQIALRDGQIVLAGDYLFDGYYAEPKRTARVLRDGWYATGDAGFMRDGELFVTGRIDDILAINGRKIHAHEIEALAGAVDGCIPGRCVAFTIERDDAAATELFVALETNAPPSDGTIVAEVNRALEQHLAIAARRVLVLPPGRLVKTTSGKISRVENRRLFESGGLAEPPQP